MNIKLDLYDQKIIEILLLNSRESITQISKKIKLSRDNVNYRLNRLVNRGIIKNFTTEFNEEYLQIKHHVLFAQLTRLQQETEEIILHYLKEHKYVSWIGTLAGKWTLVFDIYVLKNIELSKIIGDILSKYGNHFEEYAVLELESGDYFFEKFIERKLKEITPTKKKIKPKKSLDHLDLKIMFYLNKNSRINYAELSEKVGLTANGIKNRIKLLETNNIIQKYSINLNYKTFGYEWYGIQLKLSRYDEETIKKIKNFFKYHENVIFYYKYLGQWDYDVGLIAKSSAELRNFINELRTRFPEELKIIDVFITLEEVKNHQLPNGIFSK